VTASGPTALTALTWKITGLPLHPLVVHAAVVFAPLSAAAAIAYVALPKYRDQLRWPTLIAVVIGFLSIWAAYLTGNNFFADPRFAQFSGAILDRIHKHQSYARTLRWIMTAFALVAVAATLLHDKAGTRRNVLGAVVVALAVLTLVWTVLTGDAGARAVWS
jgi:hypothetical protein